MAQANKTSDIGDLIEFPRETMEIELKEWLDLSAPIARAKIARHLAALANHGGGWLIFGFKDDLNKDEKRPLSLEDYNRDTFTSIIKHYLSPTFECDISLVTDNNDQKFPVVRVPSHDRVPIAAKADGPKNDKGKIQGINAGTYYIRKPGPESARIIGAEEWIPLIRRCLLNDKESLLSDISKLVQTSGALWAYDYEGHGIHVTAPENGLTAYVRGSGSLSFNFCRVCGNLVCWRGTRPGKDGRTRIAVNLRLAEPGDVASIPLQCFEGLHSFEDLPRDGRKVADVWF